MAERQASGTDGRKPGVGRKKLSELSKGMSARGGIGATTSVKEKLGNGPERGKTDC